MNKTTLTVSLGRSILSVRFGLSVIVLALAAAQLRPGIRVLARYYEKKPMPIRRPLDEFDISSLPSFSKGWKSTSGKVPVIESLGTEEYALIVLEKTGPNPNHLPARLFVTYYNDPRDKVPHTPDVCGRQEGGVVKKMTTITIDTPELAPKYERIQAKLLIMKTREFDAVFIFCFFAEGKFRHTREQVRWILGKPGNRYTYFSKIEVLVPFRTSSEQADAVEKYKKLFREALPVLLTEYFPDTEQLTRR